MDERMFRAILAYLNEKGKAVKNGSRGRGVSRHAKSP